MSRSTAWNILLISAAAPLFAQPADTLSYNVCTEITRAVERSDGTDTPFCITGQVLLVNHTPISTEIAISDDTGNVILWAPPRTRAELGSHIVASGAVRADRDVPSRAFCQRLDRIGSAPLPQPASVTTHDIISGQCDWQLIKVRGKLQDVFPSEFTKDWILLTVTQDGMTVHASTPRTDGLFEKLSALCDAVIDLTCIPLPQDGSKRTKLGRILHYSGLKDIRVISPPPTDSRDTPSIDDIRNLPPSVVSTLGKHSVHGRVMAIWDGINALLRTERGEFCKISFKNRPPARVNDFITAIGFPESDLQHINMISAATCPSSPFACTNVPPADIVRILTRNKDPLFHVTKQHGHLVHLEGKIRTKPSPDNPNKVFYVDIGNYLIPVNFSSATEVLPLLELESRIEVTGVCVLDIENWRPRQTFPRVNGFFIVLRSPDDLHVLARPPWWTPWRLMTVIGALLAFLVGVLTWNVTLRRLATRKGHQLLREQLGRVKADLKTEERTRLAVELHDTLAQNLTGVSMEIEAAKGLRGDAPPEMLAHIDIAAKALRSCRDELRNCLWDLRSQALEESDLNTAILRTLQPHVNDSRIAVRFNVPRTKISDNTAHALLRVIRELVVNAIHHGNATAVRVAGSLDADALMCSVADNGSGFDPETAPGVLQGHFGLQGIRERIEELGGTFALESAPGTGTKATIVIPSPKEAS